MQTANAVQVRHVKDHPAEFVEGFREQIDALDTFFRIVSQDKQGQAETGIKLSRMGRAEDFLQSYLDMLRVIYEPAPLAPFFLNGHPELVADHIPNSEFRFAYGSFLSDPASNFSDFFEKNVMSTLQQYGYDQKCIRSAFFSVCVGRERYNLTEMSEVLATLKVRPVSQEHEDMENVVMHSSYFGELDVVNDNVFAGMAMDSSLDDRCRASVWVFC